MRYLRHCEQEDGSRLKHMQEMRDLRGEEIYYAEQSSSSYSPLMSEAKQGGPRDVDDEVSVAMNRLKDEQEKDLKCLRNMQEERDGQAVSDNTVNTIEYQEPSNTSGDVIDRDLAEGFRDINICKDKLAEKPSKKTSNKPRSRKSKTRKSDSEIALIGTTSETNLLNASIEVPKDKSTKVQRENDTMVTYAERLDQHLESRKSCQGFVFTSSKVGKKIKLKTKAEIKEMKKRAEMVVLGRETVKQFLPDVVARGYGENVASTKPSTPTGATRIPTPPTLAKPESKPNKWRKVSFQPGPHKTLGCGDLPSIVTPNVLHPTPPVEPIKPTRPKCRRVPSVGRIVKVDNRGAREMPAFADVLANAKAQMISKPRGGQGIPYAILDDAKY